MRIKALWGRKEIITLGLIKVMKNSNNLRIKGVEHLFLRGQNCKKFNEKIYEKFSQFCSLKNLKFLNVPPPCKIFIINTNLLCSGSNVKFWNFLLFYYIFFVSNISSEI